MSPISNFGSDMPFRLATSRLRVLTQSKSTRRVGMRTSCDNCYCRGRSTSEIDRFVDQSESSCMGASSSSSSMGASDCSSSSSSSLGLFTPWGPPASAGLTPFSTGLDGIPEGGALKMDFCKSVASEVICAWGGSNVPRSLGIMFESPLP